MKTAIPQLVKRPGSELSQSPTISAGVQLSISAILQLVFNITNLYTGIQEGDCLCNAQVRNSAGTDLSNALYSLQLCNI